MAQRKKFFGGKPLLFTKEESSGPDFQNDISGGNADASQTRAEDPGLGKAAYFRTHPKEERELFMDELAREKRDGFSWWYLKDVPVKKKLLGDRHQTPGFGLGARLFACFCKEVLDSMGPDEGEAVIRLAVEAFGLERGRSIARVVRSRGLPLTFKNWLIHTDIGGDNFGYTPRIDNNDLVVRVKDCTFINAARDWGMGKYAARYCKYADTAILKGYNPDIRLVLESRHETGRDYCLFRYIMKQSNKAAHPQAG